MSGELTTNLKPSTKYDVCLTEKGQPATNRIIEVDAVPTAEETVCRGRGGERTRGVTCCVDEDQNASEQQIALLRSMQCRLQRRRFRR